MTAATSAPATGMQREHQLTEWPMLSYASTQTFYLQSPVDTNKVTDSPYLFLDSSSIKSSTFIQNVYLSLLLSIQARAVAGDSFLCFEAG